MLTCDQTKKLVQKLRKGVDAVVTVVAAAVVTVVADAVVTVVADAVAVAALTILVFRLQLLLKYLL